MIRRSLPLLRNRQTTATCCVGNAFLGRAHQLPSLKHRYWNQHINDHVLSINHDTSRTFHSTIDARDGRNSGPRSQDHPHRRDQTFNNNRNNRNHDNAHHGGGRKGNNFRVREGDSELTPAYIFHLEQRAKEHIKKFPIDHASNSDAAALLSPWHRTTVELIMLMSKLWGRKDHGSDKMKLCQFVSLANDLVVKVLMIRKSEIDNIIEEGTSLNEPDYDTKQRSTNPTGRNRPHVETLNTEVLCQTVALGWSRCDPEIAADAARNAQAIFDMLEDICFRREIMNSNSKLSRKVSFELRDVTPNNTRLLNHVLSTWSRSFHPDAETNAKMLLDRMVKSRGLFPRPDTISYNNLLNVYAIRGNVSAAKALLRQMEESNHGVSADVYSYSIVMNAFQKRFTSGGHADRDMKDPERAEELLSHLVTKYEKSGFQTGRLRPSNVTFSTVISMYAQADRMLKEDDRYSNTTRNWKARNMVTNINSKDVGWGATNAERVLDWIIGLSERERRSKNIIPEDGRTAERHGGFNPEIESICPTARDFVTVMDAWAKAGKGIEGAQRCERLLNRLVSLYNKLGIIELRPNPMCFGTVIDAWAKADDKHESAEHAESLLGRMEELFLNRNTGNKKEMLSNIAYNLVIDAWSRRSGNAAERAESILRRLVYNYQLTNNRLLRPDVISYTAVMKAYVNHPDGGEKALEILDEMNNQFREGNPRARPDTKSISVAMDACAKSGLTSEAERLLNEIDDSKKNCLLFNTVMSGYKSEGRGNAAEAALRRMISLSEKGWEHCSPDAISYTLCMEAWGNSTSHERVPRASALLDECIRRHHSGDNKCKPSNVIFNAFAHTISNSDSIERETDILALFEKMESIGCETSLISFNILIKTCANATGSDERKRNALQIAASAYNSLPSAGLRASSITYTGMIHVMLNLMDNSTEKVEAIGGIFRRCCDEGFLNQHMINILAAATSEDDLLSITGSKSSKIISLPAEWSRNSSHDSTAL